MDLFVGVDCTFGEDNRVHVRRIKRGDAWLVVEQGRQWSAEDGRHVLVLPPDGRAVELLLSNETLRWQLLPSQGGPTLI